MQDIRGNLKRYNKIDIAVEYFNLALSEYMKGENSFSVIHLAAAAEEIFGEILSFNEKENALNATRKWFRSWYAIREKNTPSTKDLNKHILKTKNAIKHIDTIADIQIEIDIDREAKETIDRAIENFNKIPELRPTKELLAYLQHKRA